MAASHDLGKAGVPPEEGDFRSDAPTRGATILIHASVFNATNSKATQGTDIRDDHLGPSGWRRGQLCAANADFGRPPQSGRHGKHRSTRVPLVSTDVVWDVEDHRVPQLYRAAVAIKSEMGSGRSRGRWSRAPGPYRCCAGLREVISISKRSNQPPQRVREPPHDDRPASAPQRFREEQLSRPAPPATSRGNSSALRHRLSST